MTKGRVGRRGEGGPLGGSPTLEITGIALPEAWKWAGVIACSPGGMYRRRSSS
jgi:hypothetical protein